MKELIKSRLNRIENLTDRALLKQIVNGVFIGLADYTEEQLQEIRDQVFYEIEDQEDQFDIYYQLLPKDEVDPISEFFFPLNEADLQELEEMEQLKEQIAGRAGAYLSKVYLDCDFLKIRDFLENSQKRTFTGMIETNVTSYPVNFLVKPYNGYLRQLEDLYTNFIGNSLPWKTVLHPHLYKFISIHLKDKLSLDKEEKIKKISFDLEEMKPYQRIDTIPLWNIRILDVRNESFAVPAQDHINYQHTINIEKFGMNHGYLVDTSRTAIHYVRKTQESMTIISPNEKILNWQIYQFVQPESFLAELTIKSNHKEDSFTDRFAKRENFTIRSMCEISRIINRYSLMKDFSLEQIEILNQLPEKIQTYEVNSFLKDHIREEVNRSPMLLSFSTKQQTARTRDELSFLVSEIQLHFPEFFCIGALL